MKAKLDIKLESDSFNQRKLWSFLIRIGSRWVGGGKRFNLLQCHFFLLNVISPPPIVVISKTDSKWAGSSMGK